MKNLKNNLIDEYYSDLGQLPSENDKKITYNTISYLLEAGVDKYSITSLFKEVEFKDALEFKDITNSVYDENSLLKKDVFYFHKDLQIISEPSGWDDEKTFYIEMKINYKIEDALNYFISSNKVKKEWINTNKELGSIKHLLNTYKKYDFIEPIDFFLHLCDYASSVENSKVNEVYELSKYESELAQYLESDVNNAKLKNKNKIIWRS